MKKTCKQIGSLLYSYATGELSGEKSRAVEAHVGECPQCARSLEANVRLREGFSLLHEREEPRDMWKGYWEEIEEAVQVRQSTWRLWRPVAATAAAAVFVLLLALPLWRREGVLSKAPVEVARAQKEEYCVVRRAQAGDPSSSLMIYQVDEARLTIIWLLESPDGESLSMLEKDVTARA